MTHAQIFHYGIPKGFVLKTKLTKDFSYFDKSHNYTFKVLEAVLGHNISDTDWFILRESDIAVKPPQLKEESSYNVTKRSDGTFSIVESEVPSGGVDVEVKKKGNQEGQEDRKQGQEEGVGEKGGKEEEKGSGEDKEEQEKGGKGKPSDDGIGQGHGDVEKEEEPEKTNQ